MLSLLLAVALAKDEGPTSPPVEPVLGPAEVARFTVSEGTWMNVDVHPDGDRVAFDLLGHVYVVPLSGGEATRLTDGHAWHFLPRWSPDGTRLAYTSDEGGGDNLWVMDADGGDARAITDASFRLVAQPDWTPDGRWIYGRKHFTGTRSLGTGEIWAFDPSGEGDGVAWTEKGHLQADVNEPHVDPDGTWLYTTEAGPFDYNRDVYDGIYRITRTNLQTGEVETVASGPGGALRPAVSPDGSTLGYLRRHLDGQRTTWVLRDLDTGRERVAFEGLDRDQQETWSLHGTHPTWDWLPDGSGAVFSFDGGLHVVSTDGEVRDIPFTAEVARPYRDAVRQRHDLAPAEVEAKAVRWPRLTPGEDAVVFQALGRVWWRALPDGAPVPVSPEDRFAFAPAVSPDGRRLAFTTWDDVEGGAVWVQPIGDQGPSGAPFLVSDDRDMATNPSFDAAGRRLVWVRGDRSAAREGPGPAGLHLQWRALSNDGRPAGAVHDAGEVAWLGAGVRPPRPTFAPDGDHLWVTDRDGEDIALVQLTLDGHDRRVLASGDYAAEIVPSPDGRWIAWKAQHTAYVAPWPPRGVHPLALGEGAGGTPAVRLSAELGEWLHWADPDTLTYAAGPTVYAVDLADGLPAPAEAPATKKTRRDPWPDGTLDPVGRPIETGLTVDRPVPDGTIALTHARILPLRLDGAPDEVIEDGTLVIRGDRLVAVGPSGSVTVPSGAEVRDLEGRTVIPGLIDVHAHMGYGYADVVPETIAAYAANLAYGVTTTHDPSADTHHVFAMSELERAGRIVAPRITSTGYILYGAETDDKAVVESLDDAREHLRRIARYGGFSVKSYNQPRRDQRLWVLRAAEEEGMLVMPEGGSTLQHNLTMIADGHTGIEHAIPVEQLRDDVVRFWSMANGVHYTLTLLVGYGGVWGENTFYERHDIWRKDRLQRFTPPGLLESKGKRRTLVVEPEEYHHRRLAATAWRLAQQGVRVNLGAHGQLQGLGPHWELWALGEGGFPAMEALRAATIHGAAYLGLDHQLGSLEAGKLADLVVLDADPLERLENTEQVHLVMKGGVLYDPDTLATLWPVAGDPLPTPWHDARQGGGPTLPWFGADGGACHHADVPGGH